jgi:hypothetical protein
MKSRFFGKLRKSKAGVGIRQVIREWPGYQQIPNPYSADSAKSKLREMFSFISATLIMDKFTKQKIRNTRTLQNSKESPVLLIGSGPSAKFLTIEQILYFKSIGGQIAVMNSFFRTELAKQVVPDYYLIVDPDFWYPKFKNLSKDRENIVEFIEKAGPYVTIVQPAMLDPIVTNHQNYIFIDGRSVQGLRRLARPDKPWGLPPSVALYAIATLKFLGHKMVYFTGLDSNFINFFFANDLNIIVNMAHGQYSYEVDQENKDYLEPLKPEEELKLPFRHLADLNYAHGIFLRDMYYLCKSGCINVGNDRTNDAAPRACLLPRNIEKQENS